MIFFYLCFVILLNIIELGFDILFRIMYLVFKCLVLNVKDVNYISIYFFYYGFLLNINGRSVNLFRVVLNICFEEGWYRISVLIFFVK